MHADYLTACNKTAFKLLDWMSATLSIHHLQNSSLNTTNCHQQLQLRISCIFYAHLSAF